MPVLRPVSQLTHPVWTPQIFSLSVYHHHLGILQLRFLFSVFWVSEGLTILLQP